ncbi:DUF2752 domain-containing protein [Mucilaginibacter mali]|uniref:DUF2752 domain-containing protein n=1 Tax=Mucilaginibacter mali TaxID=2740462 RepID=A0A7D4U0W5_9SPHI|nr:DUF2752 domain-containing protein [Mucilaginibacter mali]
MKLIRSNIELLFWVAALIALGFSDPTQTHFVLCPLRLMGFTWCPGCGIGHAIAYLFHGNIAASWHAHWLGIPALAVLLYRIVTLSVTRYKEYT